MAYYNDKGLGIGTLTHGVDTAGLQNYIGELKTSLLDNVADRINDVDAMNQAFDKGWQGLSRDRFDAQFEKQRQAVIEDLQAEYNDVIARLEELANDYINQDKNMIIE